MLYFIKDQVLSKVIIQICVEKKDSEEEIHDKKLRKNNDPEVLKILTFYFYKKVLPKICIKGILESSVLPTKRDYFSDT